MSYWIYQPDDGRIITYADLGSILRDDAFQKDLEKRILEHLNKDKTEFKNFIVYQLDDKLMYIEDK